MLVTFDAEQFPSIDKGLRHLRMENRSRRGRCMWDCHVLHESVWSGGEKRKGERKRGKKLPAISHGAGYCAVNKISSAHVTITLVVNGSTGWFYIYVYIFRKFERKLPSMSVEIGFEGKRNDSRRICFMGELEKKKIVRWNETGRYLENAKSNYYLIISFLIFVL